SVTSAAIWAMVRPSTVGWSPWRRPGFLSSSRMTSATPPPSYMPSVEQRPETRVARARLVHVERGGAAARPHVADERRPVGDDPELIDVERDAELVGDREEVEDAVRRTAGRGDRGDGVLEGGSGDDVGRPDVAAHEIHDQLAGPVSGCLLGRVLGRDPVEACGREADELHGRAHRV